MTFGLVYDQALACFLLRHYLEEVGGPEHEERAGTRRECEATCLVSGGPGLEARVAQVPVLPRVAATELGCQSPVVDWVAGPCGCRNVLGV